MHAVHVSFLPAERPGLRQLASLTINKLLPGPRPSGAWSGLLFNIAPFTGRPVRFGMLSQYYPANTPASFRGRPQYHCFARLQCGLQVQPRKAQGREDFDVWGGGWEGRSYVLWYCACECSTEPGRLHASLLLHVCCGFGYLISVDRVAGRKWQFCCCTLHLHVCAYVSPRVLCCIVHESCIVVLVVFFRSQQHVTAFNPSFVDSSN